METDECPILDYAFGYAMEWVRRQELPGCLIAAVHQGAFVVERGFGCAYLSTGEQLPTP
jgi:hypothetical protein